jgi:tetratricopeptide (TPR) repeat protein
MQKKTSILLISTCVCLAFGLAQVNPGATNPQDDVNQTIESYLGKISNEPHVNSSPHVGLSADKLAKVALQHYDEGRYSLAMQTMDDAIKRFPDDDQLRSVRASFLLQEKKISAALTDIEKAISINPNKAEYYLNRYVMYHHFKRDKEGLADLNKAIELDNDFLAAYFNRGGLYFTQGEFEKALEDFQTCVAISPHTSSCYFNRSAVYNELGKTAKAIKDMQHFLELNQQESWQKTAEELLAKWQAN